MFALIKTLNDELVELELGQETTYEFMVAVGTVIFGGNVLLGAYLDEEEEEAS